MKTATNVVSVATFLLNWELILFLFDAVDQFLSLVWRIAKKLPIARVVVTKEALSPYIT